MTDRLPAWRRLALALLLCVAAPVLHAQPSPAASAPRGPVAATPPAATPPSAAASAARVPAVRNGDYIVAVVNQELVTAAEVDQRIARVRAEAERNRQQLPPPAVLRQQVLDQLIDERVQVTNARDVGAKVDEAELDRAVNNIAVQNQMTLAQLRQRLRQEGLDYAKFRDNVRDQIMMERVREKEVMSRIRVTDAEVDQFLEERRAAVGLVDQLNIAQILVTVPENASDAVVAERRARAEQAQARVRAGEDFAKVAREMSEDGNRAEGGVIGLRPADRLPDVFVAAVKGLRPGDVAPQLLRTGAGFHLLKLVERKSGGDFTMQQTHARHILLRVSERLPQDAAIRRLEQIKRTILAGTKTFEQAARENSEDGSAPLGGDLGWVSPGTVVPEFEEVLNELPPGSISDPVVSRFGVHLIQVVERREVTLDIKQQREQARNILREQKFEPAYLDWIRELRARAYVELREPPF